ncbi:MAG TPA: hypothetical protein VIU42_04320, partial [Xanthobacteraceae bacterium]
RTRIAQLPEMLLELAHPAPLSKSGAFRILFANQSNRSQKPKAIPLPSRGGWTPSLSLELMLLHRKMD